MTQEDRLNKQWNKGWVHLAVSVDLDDDVHAIIQGSPVSGFCRATGTPVMFMVQNPHPLIFGVLFDKLAGSVRAGVVNTVNPFYRCFYAFDDAQNMFFDFVTGDDDSNFVVGH